MVNIKNLKTKFLKKNGRSGKILCFTKKGFKLRLSYRLIDFYLSFFHSNIFIYIKYIHDSFRNAKLLLCLTIFGFYFYILGVNKLQLPLFFNLTFMFSRSIGIALPMCNCNEGDYISNFSFYNNSYGQISRSAGAYAQIVKTTFMEQFALIKLKTGKKFFLKNTNIAMLGTIANNFFYNRIQGKAGINSNNGRKSIVRGISMNPVDHPNGGRTSGGKVYRSFSFKIARSFKKTSTTNSRNLNRYIF